MRRVRLTEGQLHNVIRESVNQILNELDWKTYDRAEKKKYKRMWDYQDQVGMDANDRLVQDERELTPLRDAEKEARNRKYPHLLSAHHHWAYNEPLTPEEQEERDAYRKEWDDLYNGRYKYEKGGRGYYLDDED